MLFHIFCERYYKKIACFWRSQAQILSVQCTDKIAFGLSFPVPPQIAFSSPKEEKMYCLGFHYIKCRCICQSFLQFFVDF